MSKEDRPYVGGSSEVLRCNYISMHIFSCVEIPISEVVRCNYRSLMHM